MYLNEEMLASVVDSLWSDVLQNWEYRDSFSLFSTNGTHATWDSWIKGVAALQHPALDPRQLAELISGEPLLLIDDPKQASGMCYSGLETLWIANDFCGRW